MIGKTIFNKTPLQPNRFAQLPLGAVKPKGWTLDIIDKQVGSLKAKLRPDDIELLSVITPVAFVSGDEELTDFVTQGVQSLMDKQTDEGDLTVGDSYDWWPRSLALVVLRQYFLSTGDKSALRCMDKFLKYELNELNEHPLTNGACARPADNMLSAMFMYNLTEQKYLLKLLDIIRSQSLDWTNEWHIFPHIRPLSKVMPYEKLKQAYERDQELNGLYQKVNAREYYLTQARSVAHGLKTPCAVNQFKSGFKESAAFKNGWKKLMKMHGVALGMYSADDHLSGGNPSQGVNLDAVSEMIMTLGDLMALGEDVSEDIPANMEKLAFNALPAAWSADMLRRQDVCQVNQLSIGKDDHTWYSAKNTASMYMERDVSPADAGLARFIAGQWYATNDDGLACVSYAPCEVNYLAGNTRVRITVETDYPFEDEITINVESKAPSDFPIYLRVPGWAEQALIRLPDGELMQTQGGEMACVRNVWGSFSSISLKLDMTPRLTYWYHKSAAVELGPLLMCLGDGVSSYWNWAIDKDAQMKTDYNREAPRGFKNGASGVCVRVRAAITDQWKSDGVDFEQPPISPEVDITTQSELKLVPFGDTFARVAQFPTYQDGGQADG